MPEISVIMPLYNAQEFLIECLESYRLNNIPGVELVVVDDGSTDASLEILSKEQPDCKLFKQPNGGPARARNLALQHAQGQYIAFLDSDDLWPEQTLSRLWNIMRSDDSIRIVQGKVETFSSGVVADSLKSRLTDRPKYSVNIGSALFHRSDLLMLNGFDESLRFDEDTDLWIRCWEKGLHKEQIPDVTLRYRLHQKNMTVEAKSNARALLPILKRHRDRMRGQSPVSSQDIAEYLGWKQRADLREE